MKKGIGIGVCVFLVLTIFINATMIVKGIFFDTMPSVFGYIPLVAGQSIESADINRGDLIICKETGDGLSIEVTQSDGKYRGEAIYTGHKLPKLGAVSEFYRTPIGIAILALLLLTLSFIDEEKDDVFYPSRRRLEVK